MKKIIVAAALAQLVMSIAIPAQAQETSDGVAIDQTAKGKILRVTSTDGTQFIIDLGARKQYIVYADGKREERRL